MVGYSDALTNRWAKASILCSHKDDDLHTEFLAEHKVRALAAFSKGDEDEFLTVATDGDDGAAA